MRKLSPALAGYEPDLRTVEMLCERLGQMGLPIGPDTARELALSVLAFEAPRMEKGVRDALVTSIETIRVAAQSAIGVLAATKLRAAAADSPVERKTPRPSGRRRAIARRYPDDVHLDQPAPKELRPVFRRPRS